MHPMGHAAPPPAFHELRFAVPPLWSVDWEGFPAAEGLEQDITRQLGRMGQLGRLAHDTEATPERAAWVQLWTLAFALLRDTLWAWREDNTLSLHLLSRTAFEADLNVLTMLHGAVDDQGADDHDAVIDRLRAYAAWCLWQDMALYDSLLNERNLRAAFDPRVSQGLAQSLEDDPEKRRWFEELFGPVVPDDDVQVARQEAAAESMWGAARRRVESWLRDPRLKPWRQELEEAARRREPVRSYADLIKSQESVARQLEELGMAQARAIYIGVSHYVHGATFDCFLKTTRDQIIPMGAALPGKEEAAIQVFENVRHMTSLLGFVGHRILWPQQTSARGS